MTVLISLLAQPSAGKTSLAARLFAALKDKNLNAEFAPEYVKGWAWDNRAISPYDQFYFFGKEAHNQSHLYNKADIVISDSPVMLTAFYHWYYNKDNALREICKNFYDMSEKVDKVITLNYLLPRKKKYIQAGRYQTEEQADEVGELLRAWLRVEAYPFKELTCPDEDRLGIIMKDLEEVTHGFTKFVLD